MSITETKKSKNSISAKNAPSARSSNVIKIYENIGEYEGQMKDGKRDGRGKMTYKRKAFKWMRIYYYDGDWKDDKRHGSGKMQYKHDRLCTGTVYFENDILIKGENITYENGDIYNGELRDDGAKSGKGTMKYANGDKYEGEWNFDRYDGTLTYNNGDKYEGKFFDDMKNGKGKMTYVDGSVYEYEGEWSMDKKDGNGKITYVDGTVYEGEFKNDMKNGKGKLTKNGKVIFDGKWINDKQKTISYRANKKMSTIFQTVKNTVKNAVFGSKKTVTRKKRSPGAFFSNSPYTHF